MRASLTLLAAVMIAGPGQAATISITAVGALDEYFDPDGLLQIADPSPGTQLSVTFTFDDTKFDLAEDDPHVGVYITGVSGMVLSAGGVSLPPRGDGTIIILYDNESSDLWLASFAQSVTGPGGVLLQESIQLVFAGPTGPLGSDALLPPPWPSNWGSARIEYVVQEEVIDGDWITWASASAPVESLAAVPLPAAIWLMLTGVGLLGWRGLANKRAGH